MTSDELETQLNNLLEDAAIKLSFEKFSINLDITAQKGDGFLGELYKSTILDQNSGKNIYVVVKKAPTNKHRREETCIDTAYSNEIYFYTAILPTFKKFQIERKVSQFFDKFPSYITSCGESGKEMIVLEDITKIGFQLRDKELVLDEELAKKIFETYGRFHALSFCIKDQTPKKYEQIANSVPGNVLVKFGKKDGFSNAVQKIAEKSFATLDLQEDTDVCEKFKKYTEDAIKIYNDVVQYKGHHSAILHGDCWSNNMMFKYENMKLTDIKLLDFQLIWIGTPVYDLSYFFYSGGSRTLFKNLDKYLDMYYASFSKFARELGSDPEKLFPRQVLSEDWKSYSKFGMIMALLLSQIKLMSKEEAIEMTQAFDEGDGNKEKFSNPKINKDLFNERVRDILNHMYEINAL